MWRRFRERWKDEEERERRELCWQARVRMAEQAGAGLDGRNSNLSHVSSYPHSVDLTEPTAALGLCGNAAIGDGEEDMTTGSVTVARKRIDVFSRRIDLRKNPVPCVCPYPIILTRHLVGNSDSFVHHCHLLLAFRSSASSDRLCGGESRDSRQTGIDFVPDAMVDAQKGFSSFRQLVSVRVEVAVNGKFVE